jgi:hypothetical protein
MIAVKQDFSGFNADEYDKVNEIVNPPGNPPEGLVFHSAGPTADGGWRIVDVWDSRDSFDSFIESTVMPAMGEVIGQEEAERRGPPEIEYWEIHATTTV